MQCEEVENGAKTRERRYVARGLSADAIAARFESAIAPDPLFPPLFGDHGTQPFVGRIHGKHFRARRRRRLAVLYAPYAVGRLFDTPDGAVIVVHLSNHPLMRAILLLWGGLLLLGLPIVTLVAVLVPPDQEVQSLGFVLATVALLGLVGLIEFATTHDKTLIDDFLGAVAPNAVA